MNTVRVNIPRALIIRIIQIAVRSMSSALLRIIAIGIHIRC